MDEPWVLDGASIRISIVGFDDGEEQTRILDGNPVARINSDLTPNLDVISVVPLNENQGICFIGPSPHGRFDVEQALASLMLDLPLNPNGRPNSDVVRPLITGMDIVRRPREIWTIDFGTLSEDEASFYEAPFEYASRTVKPTRLLNRRQAYRERWWQYGESRQGLRHALCGLQRQIASPRVSKHRIFAWYPIQYLCNDRTVVITRDDDYFIGILHSHIHEVWSLRFASWHGVGNDPTYNAQSCFETFPFPWPPGQEPVDDPRVIAISEAAKTAG